MKRFWDKVSKTESCWFWIAGKDTDGYGNFKINGKVEKAHRMSIKLSGLSIPSGMCVLHTCDTPSCVNPKHLMIGAKEENWDDMRNKGRNRGAEGERNSRHKLTREQVAEIRDVYSDRKTPTTVIAKMYGVSQPMISYILIGKNWRG